jgi:acyl carrier protein
VALRHEADYWHSGGRGEMVRDLHEDVRRVVAKHLGVPEATVLPGVSFVDLGADSLTFVELALAHEFDIDIEDEDAERIKTVDDAPHFLETRALELGASSVPWTRKRRVTAEANP